MNVSTCNNLPLNRGNLQYTFVSDLSYSWSPRIIDTTNIKFLTAVTKIYHHYTTWIIYYGGVPKDANSKYYRSVSF